MWPLVVWLLLYPLSLPAADWLTVRAGRVPGTPSPRHQQAVVALYLAVAAVLAGHGFLTLVA